MTTVTCIFCGKFITDFVFLPRLIKHSEDFALDLVLNKKAHGSDRVTVCIIAQNTENESEPYKFVMNIFIGPIFDRYFFQPIKKWLIKLGPRLSTEQRSWNENKVLQSNFAVIFNYFVILKQRKAHHHAGNVQHAKSR